MNNNPALSICITTLNRADLLEEMIKCVIEQQNGEIELVIQNGGCSDNTDSLMSTYSRDYEFIKYVNPERGMGLDEGYHMALQHASGKYCWCMPDDDFLTPNALSLILQHLQENPDLLIVNLRCFTKDLKQDLGTDLIPVKGHKYMNFKEFEEIFSSCITSLSYTGTIILPRSIWFDSDLSDFYESWFGTYAAMASSKKINKIIFLSDPLILYRSANSAWTDHSFEIWNKMWPKIVKRFDLFSSERLANPEIENPWLRSMTLLKSRSMGEYRISSYFKFIHQSSHASFSTKIKSLLILAIPVLVLNFLVLLTMLLFKRANTYSIYTMAMSSPFPRLAIIICKFFGKPF
jgi:glycosyltransferase involved in cell wall biosynthesis